MKTLADVRDEMRAKGCVPAWSEKGRPVCNMNCPSLKRGGYLCKLDPDSEQPFDCYPMIDAWKEALGATPAEGEGT